MKGLIYALDELRETKSKKDAKEAVAIADYYLATFKIRKSVYDEVIIDIGRICGEEYE